MNKVVSVLIILLTLGFSRDMIGQAGFESGTNVAQITFGYPEVLKIGPEHKSTMPVIQLAYDRGVIDGLLDGSATLGVGGFFGLANTKTEYVSNGETYGANYSFILIGFRGTVHYDIVDGFDIYGGGQFGTSIVSERSYGPVHLQIDGLERGRLVAGFFIGSRYFFYDQLAATVEIGFGVSVFNIGAAYIF